MIKVPTSKIKTENTNLTNKETQFINEVLQDLWICLVSREASLIGRKEVLSGKGKFGIFGDGKEVVQVAMARAFKKGDFRSGYYRDQTIMFALGLMSVQDFFAQLYADAANDPFSKGRQMNNHPATKLVNADGTWSNHLETYNISSDISSTGGQMARALGLAEASKKYRALNVNNQFSNKGNEIVFCTIGDASTSEGVFWETMNAAAVTKVPLLTTVYDDGYGISVPIELQTTKSSISKALKGFDLDEDGNGMRILSVKGWDYVNLIAAYERISNEMRADHIPALLHVTEVTQPQGHSTSGSHGRYKSQERMAFEIEYDGIEKMVEWMISNNLSTKEQIDELRVKANAYVVEEKNKAWEKATSLNLEMQNQLIDLYQGAENNSKISILKTELVKHKAPELSEILANARKFRQELINSGQDNDELKSFIDSFYEDHGYHYHTDLYSTDDKAAINVVVSPVEYEENAKVVNGFQVLNKFFEIAFEKHDNLVAFGEDVGHIGGVNQGMAGIQSKFGVDRVHDTGIREWTIMGSAIGLSMRGMRPIAEIQYLDYLIYGLSPLSDDLATVRYRSGGLQQAPAIIRTRGHRLEGIWHAGSPMGLLLNSLKGMYVLVPRNMTVAAGFYNTLLKGNDPGLVIECLNGYRLKEKLPSNLGEYTVPLGVPEILSEGNDITIVTYGTCVRVVEEAVVRLEENGVSVELIDVQSLIPFDLEHMIVESIKKTNRLLIVDEDFKGGASGFILQRIMEDQKAFYHLDAAPITLCSRDHRPPYGTDGDYFSKPNPEDVYDRVMKIVQE